MQEHSQPQHHLQGAPLPGENFRSFLCRTIRAGRGSREQKRTAQRAVLKHYRDAGLAVDAPAVDCLAAINAYRVERLMAEVTQGGAAC